MQCTVDIKELTNALALTEKATAKNLSLAVLQCVLIEAKDASVSIRATNLDIGIEVAVSAKVTAPGEVAVPGDVLRSVLRSFRDSGDVELVLEDTTLIAKTKSTRTNINTYSAEDFPKLPKVDDGATLTLPAPHLVTGLKSVWYAAATSTMKPELASVAVSNTDGALVFVATDSFRLAEKRMTAQKLPDFPTFLIPVSNCVELMRILEDVTDAVNLVVSDSQIALHTDNRYFTSRIVDGVFPDYNQIIPKEFSTEATLLKSDLTDALKTSAIFANKFNQIHFDIDPKSKQCAIQTSNTEVGTSETQLSAALEGEALDIRFNYRYINDAMQSITADSVVLQFSGVGKPMIIRGVGDNSFRYLTMPMNR